MTEQGDLVLIGVEKLKIFLIIMMVKFVKNANLEGFILRNLNPVQLVERRFRKILSIVVLIVKENLEKVKQPRNFMVRKNGRKLK